MIGLFINLGLGVGKIFAGIAGNSAAIVADGIHSLGDLATDFVTLYTHKQARKLWDSTFPYGLGKYEAIGATIVSIMLLVSGAGIVVHSVQNMMDPSLEITTSIALFAAAGSLIVKEILFRWTMIIAERENSDVLRANAWHHRSDAITSVVALIGVGGAMIGIPYADPIAGIAVSGFVLKAGWDILTNSVSELIDSQNVASGTLKKIGDHLDRLSDVKGYHNLRVRKMGPYMLVDLHLSVNALHSVSSAHQVAEHVRTSIMDKFTSVREVLVHIEAEREPGKESEDFSIHPRASDIENNIREYLSTVEQISEIARIIVYYHEDHIIPSIDIRVSGVLTIQEAEKLGAKLKSELLKKYPELHSIIVKLLLTDWITFSNE